MAADHVTEHRGKEVTQGESTRAGRTYRPNVDICQTEDALWLWADMPGVSEESVEVRLDDDVLSIEGRVSPDEYENLTPRYTEYNVGNFVQRFTVGSEIDADRIHAELSNGVLELKLPKTERMRQRTIEIKSG